MDGTATARMTVAYVIASRRSWCENLVLFASAIPIALVANALRIILIGFLYMHGASESGRAFSHDLSGWLMIPVAALMFAALLWLMDRLTHEDATIDVGEIVARSRLSAARSMTSKAIRVSDAP